MLDLDTQVIIGDSTEGASKMVVVVRKNRIVLTFLVTRWCGDVVGGGGNGFFGSWLLLFSFGALHKATCKH